MKYFNQISWTYSFKSTKISNWFGTCKMWRLNQALSDISLVANFQVLHVEALQLYIVQSHLETWFACFLSQNMHKWGCYLQKDRMFSPSLNSRVQTNRTYTSARFRPSSHKCIFKEMQFCWCIFTKTAPQQFSIHITFLLRFSLWIHTTMHNKQWYIAIRKYQMPSFSVF